MVNRIFVDSFGAAMKFVIGISPFFLGSLFSFWCMCPDSERVNTLANAYGSLIGLIAADELQDFFYSLEGSLMAVILATLFSFVFLFFIEETFITLVTAAFDSVVDELEDIKKLEFGLM